MKILKTFNILLVVRFFGMGRLFFHASQFSIKPRKKQHYKRVQDCSVVEQDLLSLGVKMSFDPEELSLPGIRRRA